MPRHLPSSAKVAAAVVLATSALLLLWHRLRTNVGPQEWFYDLSQHKLYTAPLGSITPLPGIGGESGDGVEAKVVAPEGKCGNASARRIAYLVSYTEEYKRLKEEAVKTGKSNQTAERSFQAASTLVRRETDTQWYPATSEEGVKIIDEANDLMMGKTDGVKYRPCKPG